MQNANGTWKCFAGFAGTFRHFANCLLVITNSHFLLEAHITLTENVLNELSLLTSIHLMVTGGVKSQTPLPTTATCRLQVDVTVTSSQATHGEFHIRRLHVYADVISLFGFLRLLFDRFLFCWALSNEKCQSSPSNLWLVNNLRPQYQPVGENVTLLDFLLGINNPNRLFLSTNLLGLSCTSDTDRDDNRANVSDTSCTQT